MKKFVKNIPAAVLLLFAAACAKDPIEEPTVTGDFPFSLSVLNSDYTEEFVLEKMGALTLSSVEGLPSWVKGITLSQELTGGNSVARIEVKSTPDLEDKQEAKVTLTMKGGATATLNLVQWPGRPRVNDQLQSLNQAFEQDWASARTVYLSLGNRIVAGREQPETEEIRLPWSDNSIHHLPYGEISRMLRHKDDWRMVFNFTGVQSLPGWHFFGLYNRYSGYLRVFYYMHKEDVPTNGNDHLWSFALDNKLAEHLATQFALPYEETASADFKKYASQAALVTPYANRVDDLDGGMYLPKQGWWAFDINLSAARKHDFFSETIMEEAGKIEMKLYQEDNVMLNSLLTGDIDGKLTGKINLDKLAPKGTSWGGTLLGGAFGIAGGEFTNMYFLQNIFGNAATGSPWGYGMALLGFACSAAGKIASDKWKETPDTDGLGDIDCDINLDLNAVMTTQGIIGGARANTIPPISLSMDDFKAKTASGKPNGFGKGVWNLRKHPVVYVVTDAYWNETNFISTGKGEAYKNINDEKISYYQLGVNSDHPGLRLITFLDPSSVGGIYLNEDVFDADIQECTVEMTYGVYPGADEGYTLPFRKAAGLETKRSWQLNDKGTMNTSKDKDSLKFKLFTYKKGNEMFNTSGEIDPEYTKYIAYRRSQQDITGGHVVRRYYGPSIFYSKEVATPYEVDEVQFVTDPQVDVPIDTETKRIYDPQIPDFVVTAALIVKGKDQSDDEDQYLVHTLRFVPEIKYISYTQIPGIYDRIKADKSKMSNISGSRKVDVNWDFYDEQLDKIRRFQECTKDK